MTDSDEKAIEVIARAIRDKADELYQSIGTAPTARAYADNFARAALDAYLKHCSSTLESVVMGEGGDVEETRQ